MKTAAILIARLIFAFVFGMAAAFKFKFIGMDATAAEIAGAGFPYPLLLAWVAAFFELGSMVPGGLPYQPWAKALKDQRTKDNAKDNPDAHCLPLGNMQLHLHPHVARGIVLERRRKEPPREGGTGWRCRCLRRRRCCVKARRNGGRQ